MEARQEYMAVHGTDRICRNCSSAVAGNYCPECGQEYTEKILSLKELFSDIVDEFVSWDTRITRSIVPLLFRPGFLTAEYIRGRWASYLVPSRMYVIINVLFFFLVRNLDPIGYEQAAGMPGIPENYHPGPGFTEAFNSFVEDKFPAFLFTLIPFFAVGMHLLYRRPKHYLVEHAIFSFHFFAFVLIALIPGLLLRFEIINSIEIFAVIPLYLLLALRRVFGQGWLLSSVKALVLYLYFLVLLFIYMDIVFVAAFRSAAGGSGA